MTQTSEVKIKNGKVWQIILIVVLTGYITIKDVVSPLVRNLTGRSTSQEESFDAKLYRLDYIANKLQTVPEVLAKQEEKINNLAAGFDRLEKKFDKHIETSK